MAAGTPVGIDGAAFGHRRLAAVFGHADQPQGRVDLLFRQRREIGGHGACVVVAQVLQAFEDHIGHWPQHGGMVALAALQEVGGVGDR